MKCFYHKSDFDGICSGAIIKKFNKDCEMIGVDYKDEVDFSSIAPNETVFVVDFCFTVDEMIKLQEESELVWIDHHKTSMDKMLPFSEDAKIFGIREIGLGACALVWRWFNRESEDIPTGVRLLAEYDVWDHSDPMTLPFQYGFRSYDDTSCTSPIWTNMFTYVDRESSFYFVDATCSIGNTIVRYETQQNAMYAKGMAFEITMGKVRAVVINKAYANSKIFDTVFDPEKHDVMVLFGVKPGRCKYSVFSPKGGFDVSEIAKLYGGGGHANAAGFYTEKPLF